MMKMKGCEKMERDTTLFREEFRYFPLGAFPYDSTHSATGEYHYLPNPGYTGDWYDPVTNYYYSGPNWIVTSTDGVRHMEQMRLPCETVQPHTMHPMLIAGDALWHDYTVSVKLRPLNTRLDGEAGLCFALHNSLHLFALVIRKGSICLFKRHKEEEKLLCQAPYQASSERFAVLRVELCGNKAVCFADDTLLFSFENGSSLTGKIAIAANLPAQFEYVDVCCASQTAQDITDEATKLELERQEAANRQPGMKLWRRFSLEPFGCGRQIRFGHLLGGKDWHIVLAQSQKRIGGDAYCKISCLTAIDLDGHILWQWGEPRIDPEMNLISADVPLQVYDINGDGRDEVIFAVDFELVILDGATGKVLRRAPTPLSDEAPEELIGVPHDAYAFDRLNPDGIRICNFSGKDRPTDILLKDRYCRLYALNSDLEVMWRFVSRKNTGHFPYAIDINGDGYDELFCGYHLISHEGTLIWTLPVEEDHTDEIIPGKLFPEQEVGTFALASGTQGFIIADFRGNVLKQEGIGHAQRISIGKYRPELPGLQICVTNFWGHQGIVYLYDGHGQPLWEVEDGDNGNVITPVNWKGDGSDLILTHAGPRGGLMDGERRIAVRFPEDGHPTLCAEALDLTGDARDELVVWDQHEMCIYTQDDQPLENVYQPIHYAHYNASNYRGEFHYPDASYLGIGAD